MNTDFDGIHKAKHAISTLFNQNDEKTLASALIDIEEKEKDNAFVLAEDIKNLNSSPSREVLATIEEK